MHRFSWWTFFPSEKMEKMELQRSLYCFEIASLALFSAGLHRLCLFRSFFGTRDFSTLFTEHFIRGLRFSPCSDGNRITRCALDGTNYEAESAYGLWSPSIAKLTTRCRELALVRGTSSERALPAPSRFVRQRGTELCIRHRKHVARCFPQPLN